MLELKSMLITSSGRSVILVTVEAMAKVRYAVRVLFTTFHYEDSKANDRGIKL